ncbi:hypothetical protein MMAN_26060 [Mycobacterium mantenii]|uniref:4Fe-4S Wbl-type domain-containing protein n=1 Tax=Mycobacterium mantenii TaxID=560555 RepID=A0ABN6A5U7_MYCNT|nr:hypothetical protein [Mycobacterium mantenii]MCV7243212.1 hypothetical protein [Mycobacterium mantenii]BBY38472.1 hypothetical protein MMAN_26060 [Mycobacterium mantenii]
MALGDLLLAIHAPELTGAACKGRPEVFDAQPPKTADRGYLHTRAKWICLRKCPALAQCRAWLESLPPSQRPEGVVAGQFIESKIWRPDRTGRGKKPPLVASHSRQERRKHAG